MSTWHDVIIIGGGLVGGLTALLLAQGGKQALVLDASPVLNPEQVIATLNPRVLALSEATLHLLKTVEVWPLVQRYMPYTAMQVWNQDSYGELFFGEEARAAQGYFPAESQWLGTMVEPSLLNLAMQQRMQQVLEDYRTAVRVVRVEQISQGWRVHLANGEVLNTRLLIGADGANSFVRDQAGIGLNVLDYKQTAISCAIKTTQAHHFVARQIFLPTGPLAYLPMASLAVEETGYWQSIVWTLPEDYADEYQQLDEAEFCKVLTQASQHMLGTVEAVRSRATFPLKARQAQHYVKDGLALVGDAAHVIHPLAGQGVNLGCLDAAVLSDCLLHDAARGVWGHVQTLRKYEHLRKRHNDAMMHSMSMLGWVQKTQLRPLLMSRNLGMKWVGEFEIFKSQFMAQASGRPYLASTRYKV